MKRVIRITESQLDNVIQRLLIKEQTEGNPEKKPKKENSRMKPVWYEDDLLLALYNEKYGLEELWPGNFKNDAERREDFTNQVIGSTGASLLKQGLNFRRLRTKNTIAPEGYSRAESVMQKHVFDKYDHMNRQEMKNIAIDIIEKKLQNPDEPVVNFGEIIKKRNAKAAIDKAREIQIQKHEMFPGLYPAPEGYVKPEKVSRYNITKSPEPEPEPEPTPEPEIPSEPEVPEQTAKEKLKSVYNHIKNAQSPEDVQSMANEIDNISDQFDERDIRGYLRKIYNRMSNIHSLEDINSIADEIEFIMDYLDMDMTDEEQNMITEMKEFLKNKKTLIESKINKTIERVKKLNKVV